MSLLKDFTINFRLIELKNTELRRKLRMGLSPFSEIFAFSPKVMENILSKYTTSVGKLSYEVPNVISN